MFALANASSCYVYYEIKNFFYNTKEKETP